MGEFLFSDTAVFRAKQLLPPSSERGGADQSDCPPWFLDKLIGRLTELSESAAYGAASIVAEIIADAHMRGEPAAWVAATTSVFFPPDFALRGVALDALAVIWAEVPLKALQACDWLLRSGSFGVVILDVGTSWRLPDAYLGRLLKLAEKYHAAVIFLTRKEQRDPSISSLISLRIHLCRSSMSPFTVEARVLKDKQTGRTSRFWRHFDGPIGVC